MAILRQMFLAFVASLLFALLYNFFQYTMPTIEGKFFPVSEVTSYEIEKVNDQVLIYGTQEKTRDCDIESITAQIIDPLGIPADARRKKATEIIIRDQGEFNWGPWSFDTDIGVIKEQLVVTTIHRCHPFWLTKSVYLDVRNEAYYQVNRKE